MQLVDFRRQLHYRGVFIFFLIWRLFMNNTQKVLKNKHICEQATPNLGITQSSGLDHHAVYSRQRVDDFRENGVVSTQSARQHKDATDLVCQKAEAYAYLIRRLTPLECERLQGFPDGWTDIPDASDSARYKALGNSVYLIMVVMRRTDVKTAPGEDSWRSCFT
ncbi:MAG: DNA cytosine methyltransferase [Oscillospiraceae bacterium]